MIRQNTILQKKGGPKTKAVIIDDTQTGRIRIASSVKVAAHKLGLTDKAIYMAIARGGKCANRFLFDYVIDDGHTNDIDIYMDEKRMDTEKRIIQLEEKCEMLESLVSKLLEEECDAKRDSV